MVVREPSVVLPGFSLLTSLSFSPSELYCELRSAMCVVPFPTVVKYLLLYHKGLPQRPMCMCATRRRQARRCGGQKARASSPRALRMPHLPLVPMGRDAPPCPPMVRDAPPAAPMAVIMAPATGSGMCTPGGAHALGQCTSLVSGPLTRSKG